MNDLKDRVKGAVALAENATPGPWTHQGQSETFAISAVYDQHTHSPRIVGGDLDPRTAAGVLEHSDALLIAASHAHVDLIKDLWSEICLLRTDIEAHRSHAKLVGTLAEASIRTAELGSRQIQDLRNQILAAQALLKLALDAVSPSVS